MSKGQTGLCSVVSFDGKRIVLDGPSVSTLSVGPIEEKAIYHYLPGTTVLTAGFYGCNLRCSFCINHEISHGMGDHVAARPESLVSRALLQKAHGLAFSFSEPLLYAEFVKATFRLARQNGLYTALKTSAMVSRDLFRSVIEDTDVVCVDVKGSADKYASYCSATANDLDLLYSNMEFARSRSNLEVSLIIRRNDHKLIRSVLPDISGAVGPLTPIHLVSFLPAFKDDSPPATDDDIQMAHGEATIYFEYVYDENPRSNTLCRACWSTLIKRNGGVMSYNALNGNACSCGQALWKNKCATTINAKNARPSLR